MANRQSNSVFELGNGGAGLSVSDAANEPHDGLKLADSPEVETPHGIDGTVE
jgi:hypothetical protein